MVRKLSAFVFVWLGAVVASPAGQALNLTRPDTAEPKISQNFTVHQHAKSTSSLVPRPSRQPKAVAPPKVGGGATIQADCKTATVGSPYSNCYDIWTAAGITEAQFYSYNPGINCSLLQPGQKVCVSAGTLPSNAPHQNPDGSCYVYTVGSGDTCGALAAKYTITVANIEAWNANTYKWKGCNALQIGQKICLSTGTPPPPPQDPNLQCGPESVGNKTCPLKACCSAFGYCGLSTEFCSTTGPNPCIQNCGMPSLPSCSGSAKRKLGYYAGWATRRKCTTVNPDQIDLTGFTHVIFAFATISQDYKIVIDSKDDDPLKGLVARKKDNSGLKVMIAVGGWAFSEEDPTKDLFSLMISTSANRATFISSVAAFLNQYGLDGIDIDFEYPSAAERGGPPSDTPNLTSLMSEMRSKLPSGTLISVAAPAGYWFLRGFEVDKIANSLDHINMMSYDYHGPWDTNVTGQPSVANPHTSILDITDSSLLYVRAGINLSKVNLGLAWYGRTFHLADANCKGYNCTMSGGGAKGPCTDASGVLAQFEVQDLMDGITPTYDDKTQTYWFNKGGDLITFDQDKSWTAKEDFANSHCFGGTFAWSMDQVKPKDPPPEDPEPPTGCSEFNFPGWAKEAADLSMDRFFDFGEGACWCWDTTNWHTINGVEAMIDYIWGFGLKDTEYETRIVSDLNANWLGPDRFKENMGSSHDDALWGALMLMKMGDYMGQVQGDKDHNDEYYDWARQIMEWAAEDRYDSPCSPGLYWETSEGYQNTITSALYMHASMRQYFYTKDKKYLDATTELLTDFFDKYKLKNSDGLYIDGLSDSCSPGDGTTWTYNQGVMLSSLGMLYKATGDEKYLERGNDLLNAVRTHLIKDGILAEVCDDADGDNGGSCNFDQEGFKGIFMRHMQYFYDAVGRQSSLHNDKGEWHSDWMGLNARGAHQYARRDGDRNYGNIWYAVASDEKQTAWTHISGMSGLVAATKWGTC